MKTYLITRTALTALAALGVSSSLSDWLISAGRSPAPGSGGGVELGHPFEVV